MLCCCIFYTTFAVSIFLPVSVVVSSNDESKIRRESRTSPFCPPYCSSAKPGSKLFVLSPPHGLIVVSLHISMDDDDGCRYKAPPSPPGARGTSTAIVCTVHGPGRDNGCTTRTSPFSAYSCTVCLGSRNTFFCIFNVYATSGILIIEGYD